MTSNSYQDRQDAKAERLTARAEKLRAEGEAEAEQARAFFAGIQGQPMLPGHHSYKADRNRRAKNGAKWDRGVAKQRAADDLEQRAAAVGTAGVASDDPDAVAQLKAKLAWINEQRDEIKKVNRIARKFAPKLRPAEDYDPAALKAALEAEGITADVVRDAIAKDCFGAVGLPTYLLENKGAEARRVTKRIAELEAMHEAASAGPAEWMGDNWEMWADHDAGRIFLEIEGGRLTRESFTGIRSAGGFNWSRRDERFVRKITPNALRAIEQLAPRLADLIEFA